MRGGCLGSTPGASLFLIILHHRRDELQVYHWNDLTPANEQDIIVPPSEEGIGVLVAYDNAEGMGVPMPDHIAREESGTGCSPHAYKYVARSLTN